MTEANKTAALILARYAEAGRTVYGGQEPEGEALARAYKYWRALGQPVSRAVELAESDCVQGRSRWPSQAAGLASYQNAPNDKGGRWIESPEAAGLRFVGFADELAKRFGWNRAIDHRGYYLDDRQDDCARGCVYQLPADREGRARYYPGVRYGSESRTRGWQDQCGQRGGAIIYLGGRNGELGERGGQEGEAAGGYDSAAWQAAKRADSLAERLAEESREYDEASSAGLDYASKIEEAAEERRAFLELRQAIKAEGRPAAPIICQELTARLKAYARAWSRAKKEAAEIRAAWTQGWRGDLRAAFAESAGLDLESAL